MCGHTEECKVFCGYTYTEVTEGDLAGSAYAWKTGFLFVFYIE